MRENIAVPDFLLIIRKLYGAALIKHHLGIQRKQQRADIRKTKATVHAAAQGCAIAELRAHDRRKCFGKYAAKGSIQRSMRFHLTQRGHRAQDKGIRRFFNIVQIQLRKIQRRNLVQAAHAQPHIACNNHRALFLIQGVRFLQRLGKHIILVFCHSNLRRTSTAAHTFS